jgi:hypothetical protein
VAPRTGRDAASRCGNSAARADDARLFSTASSQRTWCRLAARPGFARRGDTRCRAASHRCERPRARPGRARLDALLSACSSVAGDRAAVLCLRRERVPLCTAPLGGGIACRRRGRGVARWASCEGRGCASGPPHSRGPPGPSFAGRAAQPWHASLPGRTRGAQPRCSRACARPRRAASPASAASDA